jgi:hypothetical protein
MIRFLKCRKISWTVYFVYSPFLPSFYKSELIKFLLVIITTSFCKNVFLHSYSQMLLINTAMLVSYAVPVCTKPVPINSLAGGDWYIKVGFLSSV